MISKNEKPEVTTDTTPPRWVQRPDGVCEEYANFVHLTWSLDDVRVRFAQLINDPTTPDPGPKLKGVAEERAAITISWRNAKILRDSLTMIIDLWEKRNGEIPLNLELPS